MKIKTIAAIFAAMLPAFKLGNELIKFLAATLFGAGALALLGCERSNIFAGKTKEPIANPIYGSSGEVAMALEITDNDAALLRAVLIETNGFVRYIEASRFAGEATSALSPQEYGAWVALFLEKDFFHLEGRYESEAATGKARYRLTFRHGGWEKIVLTDSASAPGSVQQLLARFAQELATLRASALSLALAASRDTLSPGEQVRLDFVVRNPHAHEVQLIYGEPLAQFFAVAPAQLAQRERSFGEIAPAVWQESQSAGALRSAQTLALAAGARLEFNAWWNGRNSNGALPEGDYWLAARLATIPGGISAWQRIYIKRQ
jgi:hypothetical protein